MSNGKSWLALIEDGFFIDILKMDVLNRSNGRPEFALPKTDPKYGLKASGTGFHSL
jgi:hypothetical protein